MFKTAFGVLIDREHTKQMLHPRWSLLHINVFIEKVHKQLEIDNVSTVPNVSKDISCPYVSGKLMHRYSKICFQQFFRLDLVLNFPPNSRLVFL